MEYKNSEIETILGTMEKIQIHKLAGLETLDKNRQKDQRASRLQKKLDNARNESKRFYMKNKRGMATSQTEDRVAGVRRAAFENMDAYLNGSSGVTKNNMKMMSASADTFDDIKLKLSDFHAKGGQSYIEQTPSRFTRGEALDAKPQAVDVGHYYPRYTEVDKQATAQSFAGNHSFLSAEQRRKREEEFKEQTSLPEFHGLSPIKKKKKVLAYQNLLKVPMRENPFRPPSPYYRERKTLQAVASTINCSQCIKRGTPFVFEPTHLIEKRQVDGKFNSRLDASVLEFGKRGGHKSIVDGFYNPHESRFDAQPTSSLCGGEVYPAHATSTSLLKDRSSKSSFSPIASRSYHGRGFATYSKYNASADTLHKLKRPAVPHQANVPSINLGSYAGRKPDTLFSIPG